MNERTPQKRETSEESTGWYFLNFGTGISIAQLSGERELHRWICERRSGYGPP
jgi:hypothetical protein